MRSFIHLYFISLRSTPHFGSHVTSSTAFAAEGADDGLIALTVKRDCVALRREKPAKLLPTN